MFQERSAGLIIFRKENNGELFFLLLRYPGGHWGFPKGINEAGEVEKETAIREAKEETGLNSFIFVDHFMEKTNFFFRKNKKWIDKEVIYFLAETNEKKITLSYEHTDSKWVNFDNALNLLTFDVDRNVLLKAVTFLKNKI